MWRESQLSITEGEGVSAVTMEKEKNKKMVSLPLVSLRAGKEGLTG